MKRFSIGVAVATAAGAFLTAPASADCSGPAGGSINTVRAALTHSSTISQLPGGFFRFEHCIDNFGARPQWIDWQGTGLHETFVAAQDSASVFFTTISGAYVTTPAELWYGVERELATLSIVLPPSADARAAEANQAGTPPADAPTFRDPERLKALLDGLGGKQTAFTTGAQFFVPVDATVGLDPETEDPLEPRPEDLLAVSVYLTQNIYLVDGKVTTAFEFAVYTDGERLDAFRERAGGLRLRVTSNEDRLQAVLPGLSGQVDVLHETFSLRSADGLVLSHDRDPALVTLMIDVNDGLFTTTVPATIVY